MKNRSTDPPTVTVNPTSVMRLVKDSNQNLYSVQVSGGIVHGNSGGPIMDAEGQVVAVSVRVDLDQFGRLTNIAYGVPTEFVNGLVAGRAAGIEYGQAYNKDGKVHIPVIVRCLDPLGRLQNVGVAGWVGDSDAVPRAPGLNRAANSTDANYQEVALAYDPEKKVAAGELVFPALVPGRAYFAQPYYGNALVKRYWLAGTAIKLSGPPVDPVATDLMIRYKVGSRRVVTLNRSSDAEELIEGDATDRYERTIMDREVKLIEVVNKPSVKDNSAYSLAFGIENLTIKMKVGNAMVEAPRPLLQVLKLGTGSGSVSASGEILSTGTNVQNIPDPLGKMIFQAIGSQVIESIKVGTIPLPNRKVNPNETWKGATRIHTLVPESQFLSGAGGGGVPPLPKAKVKEYKYREEVAYTFLGARDRAGRKEGIVRVEGTILPLGAAPGSSASGTLKGFVLIELDSGMVVEATIQQAYEIDSTEGGVKKKISGQEQFKLTRSAN
jgi:hypothetical protein